MPKQTFYNLPEKKRNVILSAAVQEFANAGYDLSSIQKIIKTSGIPRGSFYQYFENKEDLFVEVMVEISKRKMEYLKPVLARDEELGLFDLLKELVKAGVEFGMNDPQAFQIANGLAKSKTLNVSEFFLSYKQIIYERNHISEEALYYNAIQNSIKWGEIDPFYSMERVLTYLSKVMESITDIYWQQATDKNDPAAGEETLDEMIHFLRYGFSSNNKTGQEAGQDD